MDLEAIMVSEMSDKEKSFMTSLTCGLLTKQITKINRWLPEEGKGCWGSDRIK